MAGLDLDPWQRFALEEALGEQEETYYNEVLGAWYRRWSAFEVGLVVSRQNGKGGVIEARELAGLFAFGERLIIHTAHLFDTSAEAFTRILALIENTPEFDAQVQKVSNSHGKEGIVLKSGQRLLFKARSKGGGRGFTGDVIIMDEAMYLPSSVMAALMPTLSARPNPQIWYAGSAGEKESEQLARVRSRGIEGDDSLAYLEWSILPHTSFCASGCGEHDDRDSPEAWARANPALGIRITADYVAKELRSLGRVEFDRERLGVGDWPVEEQGWGVIPADAWQAIEVEASDPRNPVCFAIDVKPELDWGCVAAAGRRPDGLQHVEVVDHRPGTTWIVDRVVELNRKWRPCAIVIDSKGAASSLIPDLEAAGLQLVRTSTAELVQACGMLHSSVVRPAEAPEDWKPTLRHLGQPRLTAAVAAATRRKVGGDSWAWGRNSLSSDISPLVSATLALWGHAKFGRKVRKPKMAVA